MYKFPNQPLGYDETGRVVRFKTNRIVDYISDVCNREWQKGRALLDVNQICMKVYSGEFSLQEQMQHSQLCGRSLQFFFDAYSQGEENDPEQKAYFDALYEEVENVRQQPLIESLCFNKNHPIHEYEWTLWGIRFKKNRIVGEMHELYHGDGNYPIEDMIANHEFSKKDYLQYLQLLGLRLIDINEHMRKFSATEEDFMKEFNRSINHYKDCL